MPRRAGDVTTANSKGLVAKPSPSSERRWAYHESHHLALYIYSNKYIKIIYVEILYLLYEFMNIYINPLQYSLMILIKI